MLELHAAGHTATEIARLTSISRGTVKYWLSGRLPRFQGRVSGSVCDFRCRQAAADQPSSYTYLLGLYLGDGCISLTRTTERLRIACDNKYPELMDRCEAVMATVIPASGTGRSPSVGCTQVWSYSRHWPCLFPQHGAGKKHNREIKLETWQQALVDLDPRPLVEGLIHSDGCRVTNWTVNARTGKRYEYPRYHFSNKSDDIKRIFTEALDQLGIKWRVNNRMNISIAKRESVAEFDRFVMRKA